MTHDEFWKLIDKSRRGADDGDEQCEKLRNLLATLPIEDIFGFDRILHECLDASYRRDLWAAAYIINGGCSDDGFEYFRGWLVVQGQKYFEAALADPNEAGRWAEPDEAECESILGVAADAYQAKTGQVDFYERCARVAPATLVGDEWDEDTVHEKYPKLTKKFG